MPDTTVPSPCNNVCRIDGRTGWCEGCGRSLDEIAAWATLGSAQKLAVWDDLARRRIELQANEVTRR